MSKLTVVIPAYNEREGIAQVVPRVLATRGALRLEAGIAELEVLVVDDGSTDGTADVVTRIAAHAPGGPASVRLIRHARKRGYGAALQTGFADAGGNLLAFLDGDSTYPPERLPELCAAWRASGADLVLGDRMSGGCSAMPVLRRFGNAFLALLTSLLAGTRVADCCSGMRVLPAATWPKLRPLPEGLDFTPAMTMRALHRRLALQEVAIPYHERVGHSKLRIVRDGVRFLFTILRETWLWSPGRLWTLAAPAVGFAFGLAGALVVAAARPAGWARTGISLLLGLVAVGAGLRLAGWAASPPARLPGLRALEPHGQAATRREEERAS